MIGLPTCHRIRVRRGADGIHVVDHSHGFLGQSEAIRLASAEVAALDGVLDESIEAVVVDLAGAGRVDAALRGDAVCAPRCVVERERLDVVAQFA